MDDWIYSNDKMNRCSVPKKKEKEVSHWQDESMLEQRVAEDKKSWLTEMDKAKSLSTTFSFIYV